MEKNPSIELDMSIYDKLYANGDGQLKYGNSDELLSVDELSDEG